MAEIDFGNIISRSIEITKKNKWLWVYGLLLASFAGSSFSGSGGSGSSSIRDNPLKNLPKDLPQDFPQKTNQVLGAATSAIRTWFENVPITTWILAGAGILILIILWMVIAWIIRSWAVASLITGIDDAESGKEVSLVTTSPRGMAKVKHLILFAVISSLITVATITTLVLFVGFGYLVFGFTPTVQKIWLVISVIVAIFSLVVLVILYAMVSVYSERLIVLFHYTPWSAWKKGLSLSRQNFISNEVMGLVNRFIGCTVGCLVGIAILIIFAIPAIILIMPLFKNGFHAPDLPTIIGLSLLFILFIYTSHLFNAIVTVFRFSNWNLFFKKVMEAEKTV